MGNLDWIDEEFENAARRMFGQVEGSAIFVALAPPGVPDVKLMLEVGAAVLADKPIIAVAMKGRDCPPGLARIATEIITDVDFEDPVSAKALAERLREITGV